MRGVAFRVPHVISCFMAAGPSSEGVGEGIVGTKEKSLIVGDRGWSVQWGLGIIISMRYIWKSLHGVPAMAASIRLRVGLGGADMLRGSVDSSCSGRRVLPCLMTFGSPRARFAAAKLEVS
jgi:hypothetical protein